MQFGNYEVRIVDAGRFRLDGGAMFGVVPKVLWEKKCQVDEKNRILMATNLLLIEGEGRRILVDTSIGNKFDEKFANIFAVDYSRHNLGNSLSEKKIRPADITDVILTHLHFDHAGGATKINEGGDVTATFPNAIYYIQKPQLEWANEPSPKDRASYFRENHQPLEKTGQLKVLDKGKEIFPRIELVIVDGHTPAQQMVLIHGDGQHLLYAADLIPTANHIPLPWVMAYDLYPMKTISEKRAILERAAAENWFIFFEHDPVTRCATVRKTEKNDFAVKEVIAFD